MDETCVNCERDATGRYDLTLRSTAHESVPLCEACRTAIEAETGEQLQQR